MLPENQREIEIMFSKSNINKYIKREILETEGVDEIIAEGVQIIRRYIDKADEYYASKAERVRQLEFLDLTEIVLNTLGLVLQLDQPVLYTQVVGALSNKLGFSNKGDGLKTTAELLAILCELDVYDITKSSKTASLMICPNIEPSKELKAFLHRTKYLPPMVCKPKVVRSNYDSGYLTKKDSLILGGIENFHENDICLDSINKFNQVPLSLKIDLLKTYSEMPKQVLEDPEKKEQWETFVRDSYVVYKDLYHMGNEFYLTHKVDKRGRTYAQGYHVNTQGNSFRKAIIELAEKELVEG